MTSKKEALEDAVKHLDSEGFMAEAENETDRGLAILAAAQLDVGLGKMLRSHIVDDSTADKLLLEDRAVLSSLSARLNAAYGFGWLSAMEFNDINIIRDVRNKFAHRLHGLTFETQAIRDRTYKLQSMGRVIERVTARAITVQEAYEPRAYFLASTITLLSFLHVAVMKERPQIPPDFHFERLLTGRSG